MLCMFRVQDPSAELAIFRKAELLEGLAHLLRKECTFFFISVTFCYHMYLPQYDKYLEVDLIGSKATNPKQ